MSTELLVIILLANLFGFYMAWGIGANDVANAMGTSVGSGALTLKRAVILAATLEFAGAFLVGTHVSETVRKGIVDPNLFANDGMAFMLGMLAALLAAGVWLQIASFRGWPVSTTHSIVGAIVGFGVVYGGFAAVHWDKVGTIVASWVISPLLSGMISYLVFRLMLHTIFYQAHPLRAAKRLTPYLVFLVFSILTLTLVFKGLKNLNLDLSMPAALVIAAGVGIVAALVSAWLVTFIKEDAKSGEEAATSLNREKTEYISRRLEKAVGQLQRVRAASGGHAQLEVSGVLDDLHRLRMETRKQYEFQTNSTELVKVERLFIYLQILSACMVAFAHGANDVANAIGPMSAVISVARAGGEAVAAIAPVPLWVLGLGGVGIVIGLATWGWRVMETIGRKITHLTPTRGFCAEFGAATTIVLASKLGLPISTTHTLVGAVLGVGLARGISALNLSTVRDIFLSWIVTIPAGAGLAVAFFYLLRIFFPS
ncbi:MAG: inorganic phosphate transporter [Planctomycetes bacterium]|nr:inorganic phosphate transporter [Planctomycetota bacterium]